MIYYIGVFPTFEPVHEITIAHSYQAAIVEARMLSAKERDHTAIVDEDFILRAINPVCDKVINQELLEDISRHTKEDKVDRDIVKAIKEWKSNHRIHIHGEI